MSFSSPNIDWNSKNYSIHNVNMKTRVLDAFKYYWSKSAEVNKPFYFYYELAPLLPLTDGNVQSHVNIFYVILKS